MKEDKATTEKQVGKAREAGDVADEKKGVIKLDNSIEMESKVFSSVNWNQATIKMQKNAGIQMHDIQLEINQKRDRIRRKRTAQRNLENMLKGDSMGKETSKFHIQEVKRDEEEEGMHMEKRVYSEFVSKGIKNANRSHVNAMKQQYRLEDENAAKAAASQAPAPSKGEQKQQQPMDTENKLLTNEGKTQNQGAEQDAHGLGDKPWHSYSNAEILNELVTSHKGLSTQEHEQRLRDYGPNLITPVPQRHWFVKFLINLVGGFQIFLWIGMLLCFIVFGMTNNTDFQTLALGIICPVVVIGTAIFSSYQDGKADDVMAALKALTPENVQVTRNGVELTVLAESLVPGDIVHVKLGEKVPADLRVLSSADLKVNNASLTGENIDIKLSFEPKSETLYEAKNIARMGCAFTNGSGLCVVFATGDNTFFGSIAKSTVQIERPPSCLSKEIHRFIYIMATIAITIGITFLILAITSGYSTTDAIIFMIGIIVANVPEGLLPQLTVALTITAQRMRDKEVVVSNLEIIESLGAVSCICSDKTGTLTCNRMTVSHLCYDKTIFSTPITANLDSDTFANYNTEDRSFQEILKILTLNTEATFIKTEENLAKDVLARDIKGDASEGALIKFAQPLNDLELTRAKYHRNFLVPFNSTNKWMMSVYSDIVDGKPQDQLTIMMKGAPERVIAFCKYYLYKGEVLPMDEAIRKEFEVLNDTLAKRGERVLGFAKLNMPPNYNSAFVFEDDPINFEYNNLVFVGFFSLIDPPRPQVKDSIKKCHNAGIKVFMVTGDHPTTAHAIAKSLNLITEKTEDEYKEEGLAPPEGGAKAIVVKGTDILKIDEMPVEEDRVKEWNRILNHEQIVFARTMPQQKQDIVLQMQRLDLIVAMTGDGVNDAPALKAANVGIAMGSGATVAKEAGQIILMNDDFSSIVDGIQEGRLIFDNLKRCICYVLTSNIPELVPFLLFIAARIPLSIETIMIICVDVGTDICPAIALAYEEPEDNIMKIPPRTRDSHLVGAKMMFMAYVIYGFQQTFFAYWAFLYVYYDVGFTLDTLYNLGLAYREPWSSPSMDDERKEVFTHSCMKNKWYQENRVSFGFNCFQDYKDYLVQLLAEGQTAFLMTIVWSQIAFLLCRKTQVETLMDWNVRIKTNIAIFWSILYELILIILLTYVPKLNSAFYLTSIHPKYACTALWCIPYLILFDEIRKLICRKGPKGNCLYECSTF